MRRPGGGCVLGGLLQRAGETGSQRVALVQHRAGGCSGLLGRAGQRVAKNAVIVQIAEERDGIEAGSEGERAGEQHGPNAHVHRELLGDAVHHGTEPPFQFPRGAAEGVEGTLEEGCPGLVPDGVDGSGSHIDGLTYVAFRRGIGSGQQGGNFHLERRPVDVLQLLQDAWFAGGGGDLPQDIRQFSRPDGRGKLSAAEDGVHDRDLLEPAHGLQLREPGIGYERVPEHLVGQAIRVGRELWIEGGIDMLEQGLQSPSQVAAAVIHQGRDHLGKDRNEQTD